ncbi:hypothetical protein NQ318_019257, partial [Aromia moschata]
FFVEDDILESGKVVNHRKYFLGVCHQSTLEEWSFCSPGLSRKRKHKCRFKLNTNGYVARVHRRFCDMRILINNKDCNCEPTILGDEVVKVKGFPTCYMPPISSSLCKYNVCGLHKCGATTVEDRVYSVECSPKCRGGNPPSNRTTTSNGTQQRDKSEFCPQFCEYPIDRTSRFPVQRSFWSRWLEEGGGESTGTTGRKRFVATCINKYTGRGDLDCLGPGTGWYIRAPDEDDIEDDDEDDDLDEDILLEENTEEEDTITTTEELEKEEVEKQFSHHVYGWIYTAPIQPRYRSCGVDNVGTCPSEGVGLIDCHSLSQNWGKVGGDATKLGAG